MAKPPLVAHGRKLGRKIHRMLMGIPRARSQLAILLGELVLKRWPIESVDGSFVPCSRFVVISKCQVPLLLGALRFVFSDRYKNK